jgi:hypothetical protein
MKASSTVHGAPIRIARRLPRPQNHPLFKRFALDGQASLSAGQAPTPYHVYDGHGLFIGGTADLAAVRQMLAGEQVLPVQTDAGRALMGVWVFDFTDASLGAHHELQCSVFVSRAPVPPVTSHRLGLLEQMLTRPEVQMLCHGLWNNAPRVVAYNRELLALDARLSDSRIEVDRRAFSFAVHDQATRTTVVEGRLHRPQRPSLAAGLGLLACVGLQPLLALARQPWLRVPVLNPVGAGLARNAAADTFTKAEVNVLRYFDAKRDHLEFTDQRYRSLRFEPAFFQYMDGFKFVYLFPH